MVLSISHLLTVTFFRNRLSLDECLDDKWLQVTDTTVKARQDTIFSTAKLRSFADLYKERGILGRWMPTESDLKEEPIREETDDKEKEEKVVSCSLFSF